MKSFRFIFISYILISLLFLIYSYGFVDLNLHLSTSAIYTAIHNPLHYFVYEKRGWAGGVYLLFLVAYWGLYFFLLKAVEQKTVSFQQLKKMIIVISTILLFSFPAFSYDIFNYMLTAKVTYTYKENPWIVRPIEIPNEPALAYTRAANKVALYGPSWILLTMLPHIAGLGNVWWTIIMFKVLVLGFYVAFLSMVWRVTKQAWNVAFFAFNPLVLITILNEGHNDIVMMTMACAAVLLLTQQWKVNHAKKLSEVLYGLSVLVKGATISLLPLLFFRKWDSNKIWTFSYWLMFAIFLITPLREEMYPWYFVWCLSCVVFLPKSHRFLYGFSLALCFGLLLRNTPYIVTRQYAGYNQTIRTVATWVPVGGYLLYSLFYKNFKKYFLL